MTLNTTYGFQKSKDSRTNTLTKQNQQILKENKKAIDTIKRKHLKHTWMIQDEANEVDPKEEDIQPQSNQ